MLKNIFRNIKTDAFRKKEFIVSFLVIFAIQFLFLYWTVVGIVGAEKFMSGSITEIQEMLRANLAGPYLVIFFLVTLFVIIGKYFIFTKRFRGIGLKGIIPYLGGLLGIFSGIDLFVAIVLILIPTNYFKK